MTVDRPLEIVAYDFDVPDDYFPIPLVRERDVDSRRWARGVVDEVLASNEDPGAVGDIVDDLVELRRRLLVEEDPWLTALVSVRPEVELSIGCLVLAEQFSMEPDDGPDSFEALLTEAAGSMGPGARSRSFTTWRAECPAGQIVGSFQRVDLMELGEAEGYLEHRTIFGVFPPRSRDMIRFVFTVADLGTYLDMPAETQAIVETVRVRTEEAA